MKKLVYLLLVLLFTSCYTGKFTTGYLVAITEGREFEKNIFLTKKDAENHITEKTGFIFLMNDCFGDIKPYFIFENDKTFIYVQRKYLKENEIRRSK